MTIKTFIERAIEGGWKAGNHLFHVKDFVYEPENEHGGDFISLFGDLARFNGEAGTWRLPVSSILLDPEAWKAVGKAYDWPLCSCGHSHTAVARMHMMIDALAEGQSPEQFIETL